MTYPMNASKTMLRWQRIQAFVASVLGMKTLILSASALILIGCHDISAPEPQRPLVPWDYVLTEFNGESVPTMNVISGHLILHADSTFLEVFGLNDGTYEGIQGRFTISAKEDSIYFTPSARSGLQPYAAKISRDSVRVAIQELGLTLLYKDE